MPATQKINAQNEMEALGGSANVLRIVRNSGSVVLAKEEIHVAFDEWAGEPSSPCTVAQAIEQADSAAAGRHFLTIGFQLDASTRDDLEAKGYTVTQHTPTPAFGGPGGVLCQSDIPIFDDELTL